MDLNGRNGIWELGGKVMGKVLRQRRKADEKVPGIQRRPGRAVPWHLCGGIEFLQEEEHRRRKVRKNQKGPMAVLLL